MAFENPVSTAPQERKDESNKTDTPVITREGTSRDILANTEVTWNLATVTADRQTGRAGTDSGSDRAGTTGGSRPQSGWRGDMQQIEAGLKQLPQMDARDPRRAELIREMDERFQRALPLISRDASGADARLFVGVVQADKAEQRFKDLLKDKDVEAAFKKLNVQPDKASADDVQNAILNASDAGTRTKLQELMTVGQMQALSQARADDAYWNQRGQIIAVLEYSRFLNTYKDGVSRNADGNVFTSQDVLSSVRSPEMQANRERREVQQASDAASAQRVGALDIPNDKNPAVAMLDSLKAKTPAEALEAARRAVLLAKDEQFNPINVQQKITDLRASGETGPAVDQRLAALNDMLHIRAKTEVWCAFQTLQHEKNPDYAAVKDMLQHASTDHSGMELINRQFLDDRGKPLYPELMGECIVGLQTKSMEKDGVDFKALEQHGQKFGELMKQYAEHAKAMQAAAESGNEAQAKACIDRALAVGESGIAEARAIRQAIGPHYDKIKQEYETINAKPEKDRTVEEKLKHEVLKRFVDSADQAIHYQAQAMLQVAQLDMMKGNHDAALSLCQQVNDTDPSYLANNDKFREAYNEVRNKAQEAYDYDHSAWYEKGWTNFKAGCGAVWDWIKSHGKVVGMCVGFAAAVAITLGTGGLGAPAGVAIVAGIVGGGVVGTTAGAACEVASGQKTNFLDAAIDVAPSAFSGSIAGATLVGFAPAAAAGEGAAAVNGGSQVARFAGILGREGSTKLALPWVTNASSQVVGNTIRGAVIWGSAGVPYNYGRVRDNAAAGKYNSFGEQLWDFTSGEVQSIGSGGLFGGLKGMQFLGASVGKNLLVESFDPNRPDTLGGFARNVALDTAGDYMAKGGGKIVNIIPGLRSIPTGVFDPAFVPSSRDFTHMVWGVGYGLATGDASQLTPEQRREMHIPEPPKPVLPQPKPQPEQPQQPEAKPEMKPPVDNTPPWMQPDDSTKPGAKPEPPRRIDFSRYNSDK